MDQIWLQKRTFLEENDYNNDDNNNDKLFLFVISPFILDIWDSLGAIIRTLGKVEWSPMQQDFFRGIKFSEGIEMLKKREKKKEEWRLLRAQREYIRSQTIHSKGTAYDITKYQTFLTKNGTVSLKKDIC